MDDATHEADSPEAIAARLKLLRLALGLTQAQMAERHSLGSQQAWQNYEKAQRPLDYTVALSIAKLDHAPMDWIYRGLDAMMPLHLAEKLAKPPARSRKRQSA